MRIFLTGFMGCGKSYSGSYLSERGGWTFIDLDDYIVQSQGKSIATIFAEGGEEAFRTIEAEALRTVGQTQQLIVATGGGTPCFYQNMDWMNQHGKTIYLKAPAWLLQKRLVHQSEQRPLIAGKSAEELIQFIEKKLLERERFYSEAQMIYFLQEKESQNLEGLSYVVEHLIGT
ncbi:MAG: shikimate kinase [Bacteroidota bacterium]